jgi:hypothetical protein
MNCTDLTGRIAGTIWAELERQGNNVCRAVFVNPNIELVDGAVDMHAVAATLLAEYHVTPRHQPPPEGIEPLAAFKNADGTVEWCSDI